MRLETAIHQILEEGRKAASDDFNESAVFMNRGSANRITIGSREVKISDASEKDLLIARKNAVDDIASMKNKSNQSGFSGAIKNAEDIIKLIDAELKESADVNEAKDEYAIMKDIEKQLKDAIAHFRNFHNGHEQDALSEIQGILAHCVDMTNKVKKMI